MSHLPEALTRTVDDAVIVAAPRVCRYRATVSQGQLLRGGDVIGEMDLLNTRVHLALPRVPGVMRVTRLVQDRGWSPVDYDTPLLHLQPASLGDADPAALPSSEAAALGLPEDARPFTSAIDGLFYRRPSPDDPPFVEEGDTIAPGQIVGLIEVMKFFYEVHFEMDDVPGEVTLVKVVVEDGQSVEAGEVLAYVRAAAPPHP